MEKNFKLIKLEPFYKVFYVLWVTYRSTKSSIEIWSHRIFYSKNRILRNWLFAILALPHMLNNRSICLWDAALLALWPLRLSISKICLQNVTQLVTFFRQESYSIIFYLDVRYLKAKSITKYSIKIDNASSTSKNRFTVKLTQRPLICWQKC